jgi:hypothetical protein
VEAVLAAAVVVVGAIAALNLLLTFGVIRRLREHQDLIGGDAGAGGVPMAVGVGEPIAPFSATAVDASPVSRDRLTGPTLVGVFGVGCPACAEMLARFVSRAAAFPGGRQAVLAVVVAGDEGGGASYVDALTGVAVVVREGHRGPVCSALGVTGYPTFALVGPDGVLLAADADPERLRPPVADAVG